MGHHADDRGRAAPAARLVGASKRYGDTVALAPTDLEVAAGRTTVLIGPSGCGKSTVLRLVVGLVPPSAGAVEALGEAVGAGTVLGLRRRIGYVIQEGGLFPHLKGAANATLLARHLGRDPVWIRRRLDELRTLVHLPADVLDRYPNELSGGQRQRIALMRALMLEPELLLLDEPLGALDPMVRASLLEELREILERLGTSVLMVTHDLAEAAFLAHRIVLMRAGRIVQQGTVAELRERPAEPFVDEFLTAQQRLVAT